MLYLKSSVFYSWLLWMISMSMMTIYSEVSHAQNQSNQQKTVSKKKKNNDKKRVNTKNSNISFDAEKETQKGFLHEKNSTNPGKLSNTLLAVTLGSLIHGTGHWSMKEYQVAVRLMILEAIGLATILSSILIRQLATKSDASQASSLLLGHIGSVLFWGSWLADVLGSYQGATGFSRDTSRLRRNHFSIGYRYLHDEQFHLTHHIITRLGLHHRLMSLEALLDLETPNQALIGVDLDLSLHILGKRSFIHRPSFKFSAGSIVRRWDWKQEQLAQVVMIPYIHWSYAFGSFLKGLKNTHFYQRLGVGYEGYQFYGGSKTSLYRELSSDLDYEHTIFYLESGFRFNIFEKTSLNISYIQDESRDIQPLNDQKQLWLLRIINKQSESFDLFSEFILGQTWSFWLLLKYQLSSTKTKFKQSYKSE